MIKYLFTIRNKKTNELKEKLKSLELYQRLKNHSMLEIIGEVKKISIKG